MTFQEMIEATEAYKRLGYAYSVRTMGKDDFFVTITNKVQVKDDPKDGHWAEWSICGDKAYKVWVKNDDKE